jgi:hypothetical protein
MKIIDSIDCVGIVSIDHGPYLYRQQDVALWVRYDQIFPKQTKSQILLILYLFRENRILRFGKPDGLILATFASCLIFFYLGPLMPFSPFSCFKTPWIFKSSNLASSLALLWNCQNQTVRNRKLYGPVFSYLPNLVINSTLNPSPSKNQCYLSISKPTRL